MSSSTVQLHNLDKIPLILESEISVSWIKHFQLILLSSFLVRDVPENDLHNQVKINNIYTKPSLHLVFKLDYEGRS